MVHQRERRGKPSDPDNEPSRRSTILIGSISTRISTTVQAILAYTVSKAAVRGLVKPPVLGLGPHGIPINSSLRPGYMMTDLMRGLQVKAPKFGEGVRKGDGVWADRDARGILGGGILFLCSGAGRWYSGQDMLIGCGANSWKDPAILG